MLQTGRNRERLPRANVYSSPNRHLAMQLVSEKLEPSVPPRQTNLLPLGEARLRKPTAGVPGCLEDALPIQRFRIISPYLIPSVTLTSCALFHNGFSQSPFACDFRWGPRDAVCRGAELCWNKAASCARQFKRFWHDAYQDTQVSRNIPHPDACQSVNW